MIKLRLYFTNDEEGKNELDEALEKIKNLEKEIVKLQTELEK